MEAFLIKVLKLSPLQSHQTETKNVLIKGMRIRNYLKRTLKGLYYHKFNISTLAVSQHLI